MDEQEFFIQTIFANPSDNDSRLIFADWLEERNDPRAEFLRVDAALRNPDLDAWKRRQLCLDVDALLEQHHWIVHCGVPFLWQEALQRSVRETISWCQSNPVRSKPQCRSQELRQLTRVGELTANGIVHPEEARKVIDARASLLTGKTAFRSQASGQLLLSSGTAERSFSLFTELSDHFFDEHAIPSWDTWILPLAELRTLVPAEWEDWGFQLLSWVPRPIVRQVTAIMVHSPNISMMWLSRIDHPLTDSLTEVCRSVVTQPHYAERFQEPDLRDTRVWDCLRDEAERR